MSDDQFILIFYWVFFIIIPCINGLRQDKEQNKRN